METLRDIRERYYLSRQKLADAAGVGESTIVRMEQPTNKTTKDVADKVLAALSRITGEDFNLNNVAGINLYNVMRDRRQRGRSEEESGQGEEGDNKPERPAA